MSGPAVIFQALSESASRISSPASRWAVGEFASRPSSAEPRQDDTLTVERDLEVVLELETADDRTGLTIEPRADDVLAVNGESSGGW